MAVRIKVPTPGAGRSAAGLSAFVLDSPDPAAIFDADGHLLGANDAARKEGAPGPAVDGPPLTMLLPFWTDDDGRKRLLSGVDAEAGVRNLEVRFRVYGEASERVFWVSARKTRIGDGTFVATSREVSERSAEMELLRVCYEELASQSDRDALTGFHSREHFRMLLDREIGRSARLGKPLGLVVLNLDDFQGLNDTRGQAAGDEYLYRAGDLLRELLTTNDVVGRIAGDEFAVVLRESTVAASMEAAERLCQRLAAMAPVFEGRAMSLTASAGVAVFPEHADAASELLSAADLALQQAKERSRGRPRVHDPEDKDRVGVLRGQVERIRSALVEERFVPVFQPVMDIQSGRVVAVETLVRMRMDGGRLASPGEFLDAAERFGLVTAVDRLVIAGAFEALAAHKRFPELEMAINLSGHDFEDDALVADISRMARAKYVRPERITFEITETAALRDLARVQHFTRALVAEGFRFALDDFGIGFSSFRYLRELPVAALKFDISYVQSLAVSKEDRVFVRGIAEICRELGVKTVAEGVETGTILSILTELGVDRAQGHLIGLPALGLPEPRTRPMER